MECIPKNRLLEFHPDTLEAVRKEHGLEKPGAMSAAIDELDGWVLKQKHFMKKDFPRYYLEMIIISAKGSLEKAKKRLEKYCAMKTALPHWFENYDFRITFKELDGKMMQATMPKLTKDNFRVLVVKYSGSKFPSNVFELSSRILFTCCEYLKIHDYNDGYILVIDYTDASLMNLVTKINLFEIDHITSILIDGYGARLKGIHFITVSFIINIMVALFKKVVSAKIGSRIHTHKDMESLHKFVDKDLLPVECDGKESSFETLHEAWVDELSSEEFCNYLREVNRAGVDESLRQKRKIEIY